MTLISKQHVAATLDQLDFEAFTTAPATLLLDVSDVTREALERFATAQRPFLPYDGRPTSSFSGETLDEVAPHFDGVSAKKPEFVPEWLVFWARTEIPRGIGGSYKLCDGRALDSLESPVLEMLRNTHQVFRDYQNSTIGREVSDSFAFPVVQTYAGKEILRAFLEPSDSAVRILPSVQSEFIGRDGTPQPEISKILTELFNKPENHNTVDLRTDNVLIVNNRICLHGRERLSKESNRLFYRIQLLPSERFEYRH